MTTRYMMMTHSTAPVSPTPKACAIAGKLILTIDESSVAIKIPMATTASTAHFPAPLPTIVAALRPEMPSSPATLPRPRHPCSTY